MVTERQTLLEAVCSKYQSWPAGVDYFNCDPDGEVRERGQEPYNRTGTEYDFYPDIPVSECQRNLYCGPDGHSINKEDFLKAKGL